MILTGSASSESVGVATFPEVALGSRGRELEEERSDAIEISAQSSLFFQK